MVVDPQWDIEPYLRLARLHGVKIEHVLETHNHADHVSGHGRLARATGATIHISELADAEYAHDAIGDGWTLELGDVRVEAVLTDGHRPEHTSFLLRDTSRERRALGASSAATRSSSATSPAPTSRSTPARAPRRSSARCTSGCWRCRDDVEVWPGHLGGSACGGASPGPQVVLDDRLRARAQRRAEDRRRGGVRRAGGGDPRREAAQRRAHRRDQPRPAGRADGHPLPAQPARGRGRDRRGRPAGRRAHQRAVRRGPHPRRAQRLGLRHRLRDEGGEGRPDRRRADRRRRLRRLRARGRRAARVGRPPGARLPARRHDLVALRGAAGPAGSS